MAGCPLQRACFMALDEREEDIFDRLAGGEFVTNLCAEYLARPYAEAGKDSPNAYHFYAWLDAKEGRWARFEWVREAAADAVAEESIRILDEAREEGVSSTAEATLVRAQSNSRQWWASKLNRERYGEGKSAVEIRMSIQDMHLEALQAAGSTRNLFADGRGEKGLGTLPREPSEVVEGEWEEVVDDLTVEDEPEAWEPGP